MWHLILTSLEEGDIQFSLQLPIRFEDVNISSSKRAISGADPAHMGALAVSVLLDPVRLTRDLHAIPTYRGRNPEKLI